MLLNAKNFIAKSALGAFLIAAHGAADGEVVQATAATDAIIGVNEELDHVIGERADVIRCGPARVRYGGNVTRGQPLTAGANGRAVAAAPAAGTNVRIIGYAEVPGVDGDIVEMFINPQTYQG